MQGGPWEDPFEGSEKKLELILTASMAGLRSNEDGRWDRVTKSVGANIISRVSGRELDAYLLSESSLFVWDDRILMITCGKTTLTNALPELLAFIRPRKVARLFYECKNYMFPHEQPSTFEQDVQSLQGWFPGRMWQLGADEQDHVNLFYFSQASERPRTDVTLQVLMHDLAPEAAQLFTRSDGARGDQLDRASGLDTLLGRMHVDRFLFNPHGYSLNAIAGAHYATVHVTPQSPSSYASFETNATGQDCRLLAQQLAAVFRPQRLTVVLTSSMDRHCLPLHDRVSGPLQGYRRAAYYRYELARDYAVSFINHHLAAGGEPS